MYYIGIDLGGTNIKAAVVNEEGTILIKESIPTYADREYNEIVKDMALLSKSLIEKQGIEIKDVHSIGIGCPGKIDSDNGVVLYSNNFANFYDVPMKKIIQEYIDLPVYIENDANVAALGESVSGAGKGYKDCVAITLGTGVGSGIIIDGKIIPGSYHGGAEFGHTVIQVDGELCTCGRRGCWEQYSSASALIREAKIAAIRNPKSKINELVDDDLSKMNAKIPFDAAQAGDEVAKEIISTYIKYLATGMVNVINVIEPEVMVIGGGVCAQGDNLLIPLLEEIKHQVYGGKLLTKIKIAVLGNDAGIIGAAMLGRE